MDMDLKNKREPKNECLSKNVWRVNPKSLQEKLPWLNISLPHLLEAGHEKVLHEGGDVFRQWRVIILQGCAKAMLHVKICLQKHRGMT